MGRLGRRARAKDRQRTKAAAGDPVKEAAEIDRLFRNVQWLNCILLETPSGFAIFTIDTSLMDKENAIEHIWANFVKDYMTKKFIWPREFLEFEDKSDAINRTTGVGEQLRDRLKVWFRRAKKLLVGSLEYKQIIEADLGITCLYDDLVMEVMWGMKHLMRSLVPQEKKDLTKEERLPMSKGLQMILELHGFDVQPEMVNDDIVETACFFYDCDLVVKKHSRSLHMADDDLVEISGLNSKDWDTMKIATAMKMMAYPEEEIEHPPEMFSTDELLKIQKDASKYDKKIRKEDVAIIFEELVSAIECKEANLKHMRKLMEDLVQKASEKVEDAARGSVDAC